GGRESSLAAKPTNPRDRLSRPGRRSPAVGLGEARRALPLEGTAPSPLDRLTPGREGGPATRGRLKRTRGVAQEGCGLTRHGQRARELLQRVPLRAGEQRGRDVGEPPLLDGAAGERERAAVDAADDAEAALQLDARGLAHDRRGQRGQIELDDAALARDDES